MSIVATSISRTKEEDGRRYLRVAVTVVQRLGAVQRASERTMSVLSDRAVTVFIDLRQSCCGHECSRAASKLKMLVLLIREEVTTAPQLVVHNSTS